MLCQASGGSQLPHYQHMQHQEAAYLLWVRML